MRTSEYRAWLQMRISEKGAKDKISRCKKVEMALSTALDAEYKKDKGGSVLAVLQYSTEDEHNNVPAPPEFKFKEGSHIRFRMTDLRSATKDYFKFCQEVKF